MKSFFDVTAPIYDYLATSDKKTFGHLAELADFAPTDQVLDLGGGSGRIAKFLIGKVAQITVVDISTGMLKECHEKKGLTCVLASAENLPFTDNRFDKIILVDAFHHFPNQNQAIKEMARVLKTKGQIVMEEYDPTRGKGRLVKAFEKVLRMGSHFHTPNSLASLFSTNNFKVELKPIDFRYYLVAEKESGS
ncbi:MAG: class I SAM-dependent methyltransferase [Candidatus Paceibacterota bacterium]|jgi:demethylmenaquinone methyltransferase/2-methoxy-6-polyprenyl-1,4-benzoquinol methylase